MNWQPIETVPASRDDILLACQNGRMAIETGYYAWNMLDASKQDGDECNYTHWMPLPAPPQEAGDS